LHRGNTANLNNWNGISISSSGNNISSNNISSNQYGIYLYSSSNNHIYLNDLLDNTYSVSSSSTNTWHSPTPLTYTYNGSTYTSYLGNYYSDSLEQMPMGTALETDHMETTPTR